MPERLLAAVLALMDETVVVSDHDATIIVANPAVERTLGWTPAALSGSPLAMLLEQLPAGGKPPRLPPDGPATARCADGSTTTLHLRSASVQVPGERSYRVCVLGRPEPAPMRVVAGQVQLVGLERVRTKLGPRWPEVAERVFQGAEAIIRRRLGRGDVLSRRDDGFLVCFSGLGESEAGFKAAALCEEIARRLIGEGDGEAARAVSFVAAVSLDPDEAGAGEATVARVLHRKLDAARAQSQERARELLMDAARRASVLREPVFSIAGKRADMALARFDDGVGGKLDRLARSCWDGDELDLAAEHALVTIGTALAATASGPDGVGDLLLLPVRTELLLHRRVMEQVGALLQPVPRALRDRLAIELLGSAEPPAPRLGELAQALAGLCRGAAVDLNSPEQVGRLRPFLGRLVAVSIEADVLPLSQAKRLAQTVAAAAVPLLVKNVHRDEALLALYEAGSGLLLTGRALGGGDPGR